MKTFDTGYDLLQESLLFGSWDDCILAVFCETLILSKVLAELVDEVAQWKSVVLIKVKKLCPEDAVIMRVA